MPAVRTGARSVARLAAVLVAATSVLTGIVGATPAHADPWTVTLAADNPAPPVNTTVTLTATANQDVGPTPYYISIYDYDTGSQLAICGGGTTCSVAVSESAPGSHHYIAYVSYYPTSYPPPGIQATSNILTVTWGNPTSQVTLVAYPPVTTVGGTVSLLAETTETTSAYVTIFDHDTGALLNLCYGFSCSASVSQSAAGTHNYIAYVSQYYDTYDPPYGGTPSPAVPATWVAVPTIPPSTAGPSALCDSGQQVVETTAEGVHVKLYVRQPSGQETDVCVRAENVVNGLGFGGEFVITPTVPIVGVTGVGVPSTDALSGTCTSTTPNQVPGSHPIDSGSVAGHPLMLDAYASNTAAWVCLTLGTDVAQRVVVPISVPSASVTPGTQVRFLPDPGTPGI